MHEDPPPSPDRGTPAAGVPLRLRIGRSAALVFLLALGLWWALPRVLPGLVGDRAFLREEFFHPASYRVGGLSVSGLTIGGRTVDCSQLRRPRPEPGRNLLANPGLDGPCGWGFAPHLGGADDDGAFRVAGDAYAFQDVPLGALASLIDGGEARLFVSGVFFTAGSERPRLVVEAHAGDEYVRVPILEQAFDPPRSHGRWPAGGSAAIPPGTRGIRVIFRGTGGSGAAYCDELSAAVRQSFVPPPLTGPR